MEITRTGRVHSRLLLCVISGLLSSCGGQNDSVIDETNWRAGKPLAKVTELALSCTFSERFPIRHQTYAEERLRKGLTDRGFTLNQDSRHRLLANFLELCTGSRGLPVNSRYAKVSVAVSLTDRGSEEKLVEGKVDGVVDEGDVSFLDAAKNRRIERAVDSAIGKICRQLYALRTPTYDCQLSDLPEVESQQSVAVLDFQVSKGLERSDGQSLADLCRDAVLESGRYVLIERENIKAILDEEDFNATFDCDDTECLVDFGKKLRAQKIIHGRVNKIGTSFLITIKILDVSSTKVEGLKTAKISGGIEQALHRVQPLTCEILRKSLTAKP